jgi:hypothetical protein
MEESIPAQPESLIHEWRRRMVTRGGLVIMLTLVPLVVGIAIAAGGGSGVLPEGINSLTSGPSEEAAGIEVSEVTPATAPSKDIVALAATPKDIASAAAAASSSGSKAGAAQTSTTAGTTTTGTLSGGGGTGGGTVGTPGTGTGGGSGGGTGGGILGGGGGGSGGPGIPSGGGQTIQQTLDNISKTVSGLLQQR